MRASVAGLDVLQDITLENVLRFVFTSVLYCFLLRLIRSLRHHSQRGTISCCCISVWSDISITNSAMICTIELYYYRFEIKVYPVVLHIIWKESSKSVGHLSDKGATLHHSAIKKAALTLSAIYSLLLILAPIYLSKYLLCIFHIFAFTQFGKM